MKLPDIPSTQDRITMQNQFNGINLSQTVSETQFSEAINVTNDFFPVVGNRRKRAVIEKIHIEHILAFVGGQYITYVDEKTYEDGTVRDELWHNDMFICDLLEKCGDKYKGEDRLIAKMGAYIVVFPDGLVYNTAAEGDDAFQLIEQEFSATELQLLPSTYSGAEVDALISDTAPSDPQNGQFWLDTHTTPNVLKMYSTSTSMWQSVGTGYIKIKKKDIAKHFKIYDSITIENLNIPGEYLYNGFMFTDNALVFNIHRDEANDGDGDYILLVGSINRAFTTDASTEVTIKRKKPELDFVTEMNNRLWGCTKTGHELFACKQGDPTNWYSYAGLDSDSYAVTVGQSGVFTGLTTFNNSVMAFKENGVYKVYGSKPSNFEVIWKPCRGVQIDSGKSITQIGDYLYYKAPDGIVVYDGSTSLVSKDLGNDNYYDAIASFYRTKLYMRMRNNKYEQKLFVYDTAKGTWLNESVNGIKHLANAKLGLYLIDNDNNVKVASDETVYEKWHPHKSILPNPSLLPGNIVTAKEEDVVEWTMTTGDIGLETPYRHYLKRLDIRIWLDYDSSMKVEVAYDKSEAYEHIMDYTATRKRTLSIPIRVKRCDSLKLRISGRGEMRLYSIAKVIEDGSDV